VPRIRVNLLISWFRSAKLINFFAASISSCVMLPDFSFASHVLQSIPDFASKEQIGVFNDYKLTIVCVLGYITHMQSYGSTKSLRL
jgi:hypothetical protein